MKRVYVYVYYANLGEKGCSERFFYVIEVRLDTWFYLIQFKAHKNAMSI